MPLPIRIQAAEHLLEDWLGQGQQKNLLRYAFTVPTARTLLPDWADRVCRLLAEFLLRALPVKVVLYHCAAHRTLQDALTSYEEWPATTVCVLGRIGADNHGVRILGRHNEDSPG
jgi:hypothetical protein